MYKGVSQYSFLDAMHVYYIFPCYMYITKQGALAAACDQVYQLLAHGWWFSQGTLASSTTKTGRHDIAEILLKVALKHQKSINQSIVMLLSICPSFCQSLCNIFVNSRGRIFYSVLTKLGPHFVHTSGSLLISKFKCQRSRSHLNL
jgi:hypothetical protein